MLWVLDVRNRITGGGTKNATTVLMEKLLRTYTRARKKKGYEESFAMRMETLGGICIRNRIY
jgi:hypothetical protein